MAKIGTAYLDVKLDLDGFQREIDRTTKSSSSKFSGMGKKAAAAFAGGIGVAGIAIKGFADAAVDAEKSQARMQAQLKASGISFKAHGKEIDDVIQKVSKLSGLDDEDLQDAFTNIVRVTGDVNKSLKLTGLAADFARAKHLDVAKAGELVSKVAGGNIGILSRYGITVKDGATSTEALAEMQKKFAGQAKAYGETAGGAQDRFKVAVENLQEALGQRLLPIIAKVANAAATFIDKLSTGEGIAGRVGAAFDKVKAAFSGTGDEAGRLGQAVQGITGAFQSVVDIVSTVWGTFGDEILGTMKTVGEGIIEQVKAIIEMFQGLADFVSGVLSGDWDKAWKGIKETFSGVWDSITAELKMALGVLEQLISAALDAVKAVWKAAWDAIKSVAVAAFKGIVDGIKSLASDFVGAAKFIVDTVLNAIKATASAIVDVGKWITNRVGEGIKTVTSALGDVGGWIKNRVVEFIQAAASGFVDAGKYVINRVAEGIKTITDALGGVGGWIKNRVVEFVQAEASGIVNIGKFVINRVAEGVQTVTDALGAVGGWIKNRVKDAIEGAKDGFLGIGKSMINWIVDGLKGGANALVSFVNSIIGVINKIPGVEIGKISKFAEGGVLAADDVPGFAMGGVTTVHHDQFAKGGEIARPMVVVGEEAPTHPEYVIPTNPAYRGRAMGLFGDLGKKLGVPGFALGGVLGLPGLPDNLGWLKGTGKFLLDKAGDYIKSKLGSLLGIFGGGTANLTLDKVETLKNMVERMDEINSHHWPYVYGGGHGSFAGPYDCSGLVSAVLAAGGLAFSPMTTDGLKVYGAPGDGDFITIGVRGTTGRNAHTMIKIGNRYAESGSGHGAQWVGGWSGDFPIHRHPIGFAQGGVLDPEFLKNMVGDGPDKLGWGLKSGGIVGPFVGSYRMGGVVPQDGLAYVHQNETIYPAGQGAPEVRVFIGDKELKDIVRVEMGERTRRTSAMVRAGARR